MTYALRVSTHFRSGFTLVELSIVIIIVGLLTAGGLAVGASMVERAAHLDTQKQIQQIQQSLRDYYVVYGRLPCVARFTDLPGSTTFGVELPDCTSNFSTPGDTQRDTTGNPPVRIGMVPVRTLGLPDSVAQDKYGNRIIYAVTEAMTDVGEFGDNPGAITVIDVADNDILDEAVYFLVSTGRDRKGGYSYQTGAIHTACGSSDNRDVLNCTLDTAEFRDAPYNNGDVEDMFFDDITSWAPKFHFSATDTKSSSLWASAGPHIYSVGTDGNPTNTNVGIGTAAPAEGANLSFGNQTGDKIYLYGTTGSQYGLGIYSSELRSFAGSTGMTTFGNQNAGAFTERMRLTSTGNLGVGTTAPAERIHTSGDIRADGRRVHLGANQSIYGSGTTSFYLDAGSTYNYLRWRDNTNSTLGYIYGSPTHFGLIAGSSTRLSFSRDGSASSYFYGNPSSAMGQRLVVMGTGSFTNGAFMYLNGRNLDDGNLAFVAATNSTGAVTTHTFGRYPSSGGPTYHSMAHILANGNLALQGSVIPLSDERAKQDITVLENALEKVSGLRGVTYRWNGKGGHEDLTSKHIGVIAQDVQKIFPEAIAELPNSELMAVKYDYLIPPLIEAVKELKAENDALRQRLDGMNASTGDAPVPPQQEAVMQAPSDALLRWMNLALMVIIACLAYALYRRR